MHHAFPVLLVALLPAAVLAQSPQRPEPQLDPLDAEAAVAPLVYRSSFTGYKILASEPPPLRWRDANDAVERIGGWRAYAREAAAPAASSPAAAASAPAPIPEPQSSRPATPPPGHRH